MNGFDFVIGYEDIKAELLRISDVLRNTEKYEKLGVHLPHGIFSVPRRFSPRMPMQSPTGISRIRQ